MNDKELILNIARCFKGIERVDLTDAERQIASYLIDAGYCLWRKEGCNLFYLTINNTNQKKIHEILPR